MTQERPISREEVLGGLPARQASTLLYAIESHTAYLADQSRQAMVPFLTDTAVEARNQAFLQAIAQSGKLPVEPSVQELEHFAPQWASLVPDNPRLRAALIHRLGQKYRLIRQAVPHLRAALAVDQPDVVQAYQALYNAPIDAVFAAQASLPERIRWLWNRLSEGLESLPPFWTAFALTLTETVGAGILILPIALAGVGPLAGVAILLIVGLINVLTIASITESVARNGHVRYGNAYFGRLVADYLGPVGSSIFTGGLAIYLIAGLTVCYLGIGLTLADATGIPASVWVSGLFLLGLYIVSRKTLSSTVASSLVGGGVNIVLILILSLLALSKMQLANVMYINLPGTGGRPFDSTILESLFGVVLVAYFGHTSTGNCAKVVLRRDPSARSLMWGCIAATLAAMGLYSFWVLAVNSAVSPQMMLGEPGTSIGPLAAQVGRSVYLFGSMFVVLSMGVASLHVSLGLFYLVQERLPGRGAGIAASLSDRQRFWISASPVILIFVFTQWLLFSGNESITKALSFSGTISTTLVSGIFPVLMLVASRQKGEYVPGMVIRLLGHPVTVAALYLIFISSLVLHGLVIWQSPFERLAAIVTCFIIIAATVQMVRRNCFTPRLVVEVRENNGQQATIAITNAGQSTPATIHLTYSHDEQHFTSASKEIPHFDAVQSITIDLPATTGRELKVWVHQVTAHGESTELPAELQLYTKSIDSSELQVLEIPFVMGQTLAPIASSTYQLKLMFPVKERSQVAERLLFIQPVG